jgi:hypothetical protein
MATQTRDFKPCPFCKHTGWPKLLKDTDGFSGQPVFALTCGNANCPISPQTAFEETIDEANSSWDRQNWSISTHFRIANKPADPRKDTGTATT